MNSNIENTNGTISVDSNLEKFTLVFKDRKGAAVDIYFDPCDFDMIARFGDAKNNIESELSKMESELSEFKEEDEKDTDKAAELIKKTNDIIYSEVDKIFGNNISEEVFKYCSPLSLNSSGVTFIERFFNAVLPVISDRCSAAKKASDERIARHTDKYKNKKG